MLKPLGKRVLVKLLKKEETSSLLIIPEKDENIVKAEVLRPNLPWLVKGEIILIDKRQSVQTEFGLLVDEDKVLGVIE